MGKTIIVRFNFFGPHIKKEDVSRILNNKSSDTDTLRHRSLLKSFFGLPSEALSEEILNRYIAATMVEGNSFLVPHTKEIFERLLKPLRNAKKGYCLGDYVSTIALCGVVGEMMAILLWKINDARLKGGPITERQEVGIFGSSFENLGQYKRLRILETFGHIPEVQFDNFDAIRKSRKPYLHLWTADLKNEQSVALEVYKKAFQLFNEVTGIGLADARSVTINPLLLRFLDNQPKQN